MYPITQEHSVYFTWNLFKVYIVIVLPGYYLMHVELKSHQEFLFLSGLLFHSAFFIDYSFHTWVPFILERNIPWTLRKAVLFWSFAIIKLFTSFLNLVKLVWKWAFNLCIYPIHLIFSFLLFFTSFLCCIAEVSVTQPCARQEVFHSLTAPWSCCLKSDVLGLNCKMSWLKCRFFNTWAEDAEFYIFYIRSNLPEMLFSSKPETMWSSPDYLECCHGEQQIVSAVLK